MSSSFQPLWGVYAVVVAAVDSVSIRCWDGTIRRPSFSPDPVAVLIFKYPTICYQH